MESMENFRLRVKAIEACELGKTDEVKKAINEGVNIKGENLLQIACQENHPEIATLLINAGADVNIQNEWGYTALMSVCYLNHIKIADILINAGADINAKDKQQQTALMIACEKNRIEIVKLLIKAMKANKNIDINAEHAALGIACRRGHKKIMKLLINRFDD